MRLVGFPGLVLYYRHVNASIDQALGYIVTLDDFTVGRCSVFHLARLESNTFACGGSDSPKSVRYTGDLAPLTGFSTSEPSDGVDIGSTFVAFVPSFAAIV